MGRNQCAQDSPESTVRSRDGRDAAKGCCRYACRRSGLWFWGTMSRRRGEDRDQSSSILNLSDSQSIVAVSTSWAFTARLQTLLAVWPVVGEFSNHSHAFTTPPLPSSVQRRGVLSHRINLARTRAKSSLASRDGARFRPFKLLASSALVIVRSQGVASTARHTGKTLRSRSASSVSRSIDVAGSTTSVQRAS
jgi:hypothetical protein